MTEMAVERAEHIGSPRQSRRDDGIVIRVAGNNSLNIFWVHQFRKILERLSVPLNLRRR